jgi:hypothetical protein
MGLSLVTQHRPRLQSLHKSPQYSLRFLILFSLFTLTIVDLDLDLVWRHAKSSFSCVVDAI